MLNNKFNTDGLASKFTVNKDGVITKFTHLDTNVTDIVIPSKIDGKKVTGIGRFVFLDNIDITSVTIPESVTSIGNAVFFGCTNLTDIYYNGTKSQWNKISIDIGNSYRFKNAKIHFATNNVNVCRDCFQKGGE